MPDWVKSFIDKISERSLLSLAILLIGVFLLLTGVADGFAISKMSIEIKNLYFKIIVIITGCSFSAIAICSLLRENQNSRKGLEELRIQLNQLQEEFHSAFESSKGSDQKK